MLLVVAVSASAAAQDVVAFGSASVQAGTSISVPASIRDRSGSALGSDAGAGKRIQGIAFKILYPPDIVSSVTFARAGVLAPRTPLLETTLQGAGYLSYVASFHETGQPIAFTLDASPPGDQIGTLTVTLLPQAAPGSVATLRLHAASAMLSNQAGTTIETVASGALELVNGIITTASSAAPSNLVATATSASQASLTWIGVVGTDHYEVERRSGGGAFALVGSPTTALFTNTGLAADTTYLYRVRAVASGGGMTAYSNVDPATTVIFANDPIVAGVTPIQAAHLTELRTAVNAMRTAASLPLIAADPTVAVGAPMLAQHTAALRSGLDQARSALGLSAISYTDPTLVAGSTIVKAAHVQEPRSGVK
jgi:hypothetical protein